VIQIGVGCGHLVASVFLIRLSTNVKESISMQRDEEHQKRIFLRGVITGLGVAYIFFLFYLW